MAIHPYRVRTGIRRRPSRSPKRSTRTLAGRLISLRPVMVSSGHVIIVKIFGLVIIVKISGLVIIVKIFGLVIIVKIFGLVIIVKIFGLI